MQWSPQETVSKVQEGILPPNSREPITRSLDQNCLRGRPAFLHSGPFGRRVHSRQVPRAARTGLPALSPHVTSARPRVGQVSKTQGWFLGTVTLLPPLPPRAQAGQMAQDGQTGSPGFSGLCLPAAQCLVWALEVPLPATAGDQDTGLSPQHSGGRRQMGQALASLPSAVTSLTLTDWARTRGRGGGGQQHPRGRGPRKPRTAPGTGSRAFHPEKPHTTCTSMLIHIHNTQTHIRTLCTNTCIHTHVCSYTYIYTPHPYNTSVHTPHTHTHTFTHIDTHTCTHTLRFSLALGRPPQGQAHPW